MKTSQPLRYATLRGGVCVVEGYGVRVYVRDGRLKIEDGFPGERRERTYSRVRPGIGRLVLLGHAGTITLEAFRWLADVGISLVQIDKDGRLLTTSAPSSGDARLRRAQALATTNPTGLQIARTLLQQKLAGQRRLLDRLAGSGGLAGQFDQADGRLAQATTVDELLIAERDAAFAYWAAWAGLPVRFRPSEAARLPDHWATFGQRSSAFSSGPRLAVNPANALLNYLYAILEAETRIALLTVGLDAGLGIVHADYRARDSFALDVMEAIRPDVDQYVLDLLERRVFRAHDFHETRRGVCRLLSPMTKQLAETAPTWGGLIAPVAEQVATILARAPGSRIDRLTTPLTNTNRQAGRDGMRRTARTGRPRAPKPPPTCQRCGGELPHPERRVCDTCLAETQAEQFEAFSGTGLAALERLKQEGRDPTHGGEAAKKRGQATADRKREIADWEARYGQLVDLTAFTREILPLIREVPLSRLVRATGLSLRYVSQVRQGERVPHPKHWTAFSSAHLPESSPDTR
jgi:CRISPR-associated endonuclease Cas1